MPMTPEVSGSFLRRNHGSYAEQQAEEGEWTRPLRDNAVRGCDLLKSMAHEGRLIILCLLSEQERSVTELEEALDLRQPAVSQQLARLRSDRLVSTRRDGKMIFYSLASDEVRRIVKTMCDIYAVDGRGASR
ncbi:MAG: metalloregulator ArsR/SmtB family transcription factor [Ancalomicrobiaceae bacterium]|nr:metalloregulator ArsR/SmtB family transcription factor [Ancalomicrobiaceae bacterium]